MEDFTRDAGYPPTVREICKATGLRSPRSVSQHLQALERKGYIERGRDKSRAIRFLHRQPAGTASAAHAAELPLLGKVAAGHPITAGDRPETTVTVDRGLFRGEKCFVMRVEGQSMTGAHILEGDLIVVDPEVIASHGDVVVARVHGETTVKRYDRRNGHAYLVPESTGTTPIAISGLGSQVEIVGKVVGVVRKVT